MNQEQLKRGIQISEEIERIKPSIKALKWTQNENVVDRRSYYRFSGIEGEIEIPESLFKVIGKLVLSEHSQKLIELERELESL